MSARGLVRGANAVWAPSGYIERLGNYYISQEMQYTGLTVPALSSSASQPLNLQLGCTTFWPE